MNQVWDSILPGDARTKSVTLIAADGNRASNALDAISACGFRTDAPLSPANGLIWLEGEHFTDGLILELSEEEGDPTLSILESAQHFANRNQVPLIISASLAGLDFVAAAAAGPRTTWLCEPDPSDWVAALSAAIETGAPRLSDSAVDVDSQRLRRLADEVSRIARALSNLSSTTRPDSGYAVSALSDVQMNFRAEPMLAEAEPAMPAPEEIRRILRVRRMRDQFFDASLFADPAWDMLLDLMAARLERAQVAVSSLCIAASVPPTTALRWIKAMTDHALFERCADPEDGRRIFIQLSDPALRSMGRYFEAAKKAGGLLI
jgi:hypothetical protein